ncbi:NAD(P)/FAD-dependent oxidoreductase [Kordiimonas laminariae]|uniref:NAD(P)/FAD-dependent oxidoreductase n=1 Tax=Kordiimonas laminariae TaxID=2917717 RepID=UPI001FF1DE7F|nr:FAD-binding oxidoreductase [Kordiimonas laminariae]MCK0070524.1 FAD-binding oxidoreductase [Kordiimonas laminariae]
MRVRDSIHEDQLPHSYFTATCNDLDVFRRLEGNVRAEVCVIGGGFTGVATALALAERGKNVVLVEQNYIGWGASGRSVGIIQGTYGPAALDYPKYSEFWEDVAPAVWALGREGLNYVKDTIRKYGIECAPQGGVVELYQSDKHVEQLQQSIEVMAKHGLHNHAELLGEDMIAQAGGIQTAVAGYAHKNWFSCHPMNLIRGEARAAENQGVKIFEDARVQHIDRGEKLVVDTGYGRVTADKVILAGNAYLGDLVPELVKSVKPVGRYVIATEQLGEGRLPDIFKYASSLSFCGDNTEIISKSADNRLLFAGGDMVVGSHPSSIREHLQPKLTHYFPDLSGVKVEFEWGGYYGAGTQPFPQLGKVSDNILFAHAYEGQGIASAHVIAELIAEAVTGESDRFETLSNSVNGKNSGWQSVRETLSAIGTAVNIFKR